MYTPSETQAWCGIKKYFQNSCNLSGAKVIIMQDGKKADAEKLNPFLFPVALFHTYEIALTEVWAGNRVGVNFKLYEV